MRDRSIRYKLHVTSGQKASLAERYILETKRILEANYREETRAIREDQNLRPKAWRTWLPKAQNDLNERPLLLKGAETGFSPASITSKNYRQYLDALYESSPRHYFSAYSIPPKLCTPNVKFKVGDLVKLRRTSLETGGLTKLGSRPLKKRVYKIIRINCFLGDKFLSAYYTLEPEQSPLNSAEEATGTTSTSIRSDAAAAPLGVPEHALHLVKSAEVSRREAGGGGS